jgi:hypothetical protein
VYVGGRGESPWEQVPAAAAAAAAGRWRRLRGWGMAIAESLALVPPAAAGHVRSLQLRKCSTRNRVGG